MSSGDFNPRYKPQPQKVGNMLSGDFNLRLSLHQNHKQDGKENQHHANGHIECEGLMEDDRADENGRQRFEDAEHRTFGGANGFGSRSQGDGRHRRRQHRQSQHIQPTDGIWNGIQARAETRKRKQHQ